MNKIKCHSLPNTFRFRVTKNSSAIAHTLAAVLEVFGILCDRLQNVKAKWATWLHTGFPLDGIIQIIKIYMRDSRFVLENNIWHWEELEDHREERAQDHTADRGHVHLPSYGTFTPKAKRSKFSPRVTKACYSALFAPGRGRGLSPVDEWWWRAEHLNADWLSRVSAREFFAQSWNISTLAIYSLRSIRFFTSHAPPVENVLLPVDQVLDSSSSAPVNYEETAMFSVVVGSSWYRGPVSMLTGSGPVFNSPQCPACGQGTIDEVNSTCLTCNYGVVVISA